MLERIEINLLPAEYRVHKSRLRVPREIVYPLLGFAAAGAFLGYYTISLDTKIGQIQQKISQMEGNIQRNAPIKKEIERLQADRRVIFDKIRALQKISVDREKWVRILEILSRELPSWTFLNSVVERATSPTSTVLDIKGNTFSFPEVANYMSNLKETAYINGVDLSSIDRQESGAVPTYQFAITASINPDAGLSPIGDKVKP